MQVMKLHKCSVSMVILDVTWLMYPGDAWLKSQPSNFGILTEYFLWFSSEFVGKCWISAFK
jgi:hypothetical protein